VFLSLKWLADASRYFRMLQDALGFSGSLESMETVRIHSDFFDDLMGGSSKNRKICSKFSKKILKNPPESSRIVKTNKK